MATARLGGGARGNKAGRVLRYLHRRNPAALRDFVLKSEIADAAEWDQTVQKFMVIGKRKAKVTTEAAEFWSSRVGVTKCQNARRRKAGTNA